MCSTSGGFRFWLALIVGCLAWFEVCVLFGFVCGVSGLPIDL